MHRALSTKSPATTTSSPRAHAIARSASSTRLPQRVCVSCAPPAPHLDIDGARLVFGAGGAQETQTRCGRRVDDALRAMACARGEEVVGAGDLVDRARCIHRV